MSPKKHKGRQTSIYKRLLFLFSLLTLLPAIAITIGSIIVGYYNGSQQTEERLTSVAMQKHTEISSLIGNRKNDHVYILNESYGLDRIQTIFKLAKRDQYYDYYYEAVRKSLQRYIDDTPGLTSITLLDLDFNTVLSTNEDELERDYTQYDFISNEPDQGFSLLWLDPVENEYALITGSPIFSMENELLGIMISRSYVSYLLDILSESTGLGKTGQAYLQDKNLQILELKPETVPSVSIPTHLSSISSILLDLIVSSSQSDFLYENNEGVQVIGIHRYIEEIDTYLTVEQSVWEAFTGMTTSLAVNLIIALLTLIIAVIAALMVTRSIAKPISILADTAAAITAGNLSRRVKISRNDEIGFLADSFNTMTTQLGDLISSLEERVKERTFSLQQRALQLETSSIVSREIASILNIDELLIKIVDLIREKFGYHNVLIYLLDLNNQQLNLRAFSGEKQPSIKTISLNQNSLNGKSARTNKAYLINDVSRSDEIMTDRNLPDTKSELVVSLSIGNRVIGTLDVHSQNPDAFTNEDLKMIHSLGDQIAIAIENANLYEQSQKLGVLEERNRLARDLHDSVTQSLYSLSLFLEGWYQMLENGDEIRIRELLDQTSSINKQVLREMRLLIHELRPPILQKEGLLNAIQKRLDAVENRAGIEARVIAEDFIEFPGNVEECIYKITLEALNNVLKHSGANSVTVRFHFKENNIYLNIIDNGLGFDVLQARESGGLGLSTMEERAALIQAKLDIISHPGKGTTVQVCINPKMFSET